ncbi:MAG: hypothetical protein ACP5KG_05660 [Myxococcota bacterium]
MNISTIIIILVVSMNQPEDDLFKKGVYLFEHQDFKQSVVIFNRIINNNLSKDENELIECYKYLGAAHFYLEDLKSSEANFRQLLLLKPDFRLDPFLFPPSMVLFFDKIKKDMPKGGTTITNKSRLEGGKYELYINFLPFGLPQYAHNQKVKGSILLSLQLLSLTANIISYWQVHSMIDRYGYVKDRTDADRANLLKTIQITSLITFGVVYLFSVSDGTYYTLSQVRGGN